MRSFAIALVMLVPLAACTTPKNAEEARAQKCRLDVSECEQRIRNCQSTGNELVCKSQDAYCKDVRARCPGY
ncbi:MAG: hypothetical protein WAW96_11535 [Alphaproteobacteria bacterium]